MHKCTLNGCGQEYDEIANDSMACQFHPGKPVFHEGLKGWSCCKPRVHSFDEFMEIKGCKLGPHSHEPKHKDDPFKADLTKYDDVLPADAPQAADSPKPALAEAPAAAPKTEEPAAIDEDPEGVAVAPGAVCKRNGCGVAYESEEKSHASKQCQFHPGAAVFHEGTKGWTCCKPRATDFDEFMQIAGCTRGRHLFVGTQQEKAKPQQDKCRRDYYQMPHCVIVSVYAKKIDKSQSSIAFSGDSIRLHLVYADNKVYDDEIELFAKINPAASSFEFLSTKAEIKLEKEAPGPWPALESATA
ncbi:hypothetical protein IW140_000483 [Coemansia sp. RSA 1813]|nr:hypothetical protein EV178_000558 [Coemansia sp. RSA 1646]KAJ1771253.1 hypothetical protein LPJ74_002521 [Coemansia sp. RSA 1843]KAJ2092822.1 hypothetical protein IW138_000917 [Coemansia sp. RSA 986]KAJ2217678.1 hypothetical protein EV179_000163 [Coemansia sp. RSA 487]KAJ2573084.1 hypothetical protein IW140_000483 [Coemansia sp. RSA 1813]